MENSPRSSLPPPPPPPAPTVLARILSGQTPPPLRRFERRASFVVAILATTLFALTFVDDSPVVDDMEDVAPLVYVVTLPLFGLMILEPAARQKGRVFSRFPVRGWRRLLLIPLLAVIGWTFFVVDRPAAPSPFIYEGRFYSNNHGAINELTYEDWQKARAHDSRFEIQGAMFFAVVTALYFSQSERKPD